jgi:hypothetical protein
MLRPRACSIAVLLLLACAGVARADATAFLGVNTTPTNHQARGLALGFGFLIVGFEFEYANSPEDETDDTPSLRTGMGNVLLQTPFSIGGVQLYFTTGTGIYRERLGEHEETDIGFNTGGGVKWTLAGPIRLRGDYRVFKLHGDSLHSVVHRVYAGLNVAF